MDSISNAFLAMIMWLLIKIDYKLAKYFSTKPNSSAPTDADSEAGSESTQH